MVGGLITLFICAIYVRILCDKAILLRYKMTLVLATAIPLFFVLAWI